MADDADISGMPDPSTIGLASNDPTNGMPDPHALYKQHHGYEAQSDEDVADFMRNPDATPDIRKEKSGRYGASMLTGLPRAAATAALAVPAAVAGGAGALTGAVGAALDPAHASEDLEQGRERLRNWSSKVYKLGDYVPATKAGAEYSNALLNVPAAAGHAVNEGVVRPVLGDNAAQAIGDITQDVGTVLPAAGAPAFVRGAVKGAVGAGRAIKGALTPDAIPEGTTYTHAGDVQTPNHALTPDVGSPVTGAKLRAQPNPIPPPEGTTAAAKTPTAPATPSEVPSMQPTSEGQPAQPAPAAAAPMGQTAAGQPERGSVRVFNSPKEEGPQETPNPADQSERAKHLDAIDTLSGGALSSRRASAISGDYNATGDDWQQKETGNAVMQKQIADENSALHTGIDNVHRSIGSEFDDSVDSKTLDDRGRVVRNAIQGIEKHFDDATDGIYEAARASNKGRQIEKLQRVNDYLNDDSNFTNDAEIGLQRAAKQRLQRLWTTGDPDKGAPPGSVNAAEQMREFLNNKGKNPSAMGVANDLKGHLDMDVAEHGGPGLFEAARAMRRHKYQMLEEPTGIKKLLAPSDSQGINHAIPDHKVADYIADLPREQHEHVMNVLRAGAHLGDGELAEGSAQAIRELQAHVVSRMHAGAMDDGGKWNASGFYRKADQYARNAGSLFKDRPDVLRNLKTLNDAGNTLHMDRHYPGAAAQTVRSGMASHVVEAGGAFASGLAHELPLGRIVGRAIESATEKATGKMGEAAGEKDALSKLVDRNGKMRGSVQVMRDEERNPRHTPEQEEIIRRLGGGEPLGARVGGGKQRGAVGDQSQRDAVTHKEERPGEHSYHTPNGGGLYAIDRPALGVRQANGAEIPKGERGQGWGTRMLQRAVDDAHGAGRVWRSDKQVSEGQAGAYKNLAQLGYDVKMKPNDKLQGAYHAVGDHVFEVRPPKKANGSTLNVGLNQGQEGQPGFRQMAKQEAQSAVESTGAKVTKSSVLTPKEHGVAEPTLVASTNRPLAEHEMQQVLAKTKQSAIPQRTDAGEESMHIAPGHEEIAKNEGWDKFNGEYFRGHDGAPLSKQRGSVRVMNEKPLDGAPEGDRPNGKARASAAKYAKSAGIDHQPLTEYRYVKPSVAKDVADAYEAMKHDPTDPKVAKAYDAFKAETLAQYKQMVKDGVKVDLDKDYPYKNPRDMHADVRDNNHMSVYPTEAGFGSDGAPPSDHPLLEKAPVKIGGKDATYNDLFRAVHDYYGHAAEGNGFRANGEYNAWRAHRQMYSAAARGAMDAETLGQNSWVNSGPAGELNKGASGAETIYADQKAGLLPPKVVKSAEAGVGVDEHHVTNLLTDKERAQLQSDTTKRLIDAFHSTPATKEYAAAALAGAAKRGWYKDSAQAIVNQFGHEAPRFAALLSAMSPQVSVQTNFANALKTYINWDKAGRPESPDMIRNIMEESSQKSAKAAPGSSNVLDAWVNNAVRALTADDPSNVKLSGPKVHSFYNNLTDNVNEVTNDAWMASFAKIDPAKLGGSLNQSGPGKSPSYLALSAKVRDAARMISHLTGETWTPAEVQETVWSWAKTAYEHAEEKGSNVSIPDLVKNGDITDELIRSTPDFHQLFGSSEHRGLLQSSRFARNDAELAKRQEQGPNAAGSSEARAAAQEALRPHLLSAAERLEQVRQERRQGTK